MSRFASILLLLLLLSVPLFTTTLAVEYTNVSVTEAKAMVDSDPSLVILDVRTQDEYDTGHIRNAKLIPVTELEGRLNELNPTDKILVYCRLGNRSRTASQLLADNGFLYIYNMLGGITAWITENYPVYVKYASIQEAVNSATPGDVLRISTGTYNEHVAVDKTISLIGENKTNTIIDGNGTGPSVVSVEGENNVTIQEFTIQNATAAISFTSTHNSIVDNIIKDHTMYAIYLTSSNNTIVRNIFSNNNIGIYLTSSQNTIYHNTFIDNTQQVASYGGANTWDDNYPSGGNFWSDYAGVDADGDGIGDVPYVIDASNQDNFPLMNPWTPPDTAVTEITTSKTVIGQGYTLYINVTVANQGNKIEGFAVTTHANTTILQAQYVSLRSGNITTLTIAWDTTAWTRSSYSINVTVNPFPSEIDLTDNMLTYPVKVTIPGDINGDFYVNITDATQIGVYWMQLLPPGPPNVDLNSDGLINIKDATTIGINWLKHA